MEPFVLRDAHVTLSVPTLADVDQVAEACTDPEIAAWTVVPSPYTRQDAEGFVTQMVADGWGRDTMYTWAVRPAGQIDGPVLGMMGVGVTAGAPGADRAGEIGYWTAPDARGRGITTAAARLAADWALSPDGLGLTRLQWQAYVGNWPSRRVAWRLGFRSEGTLRRYGMQRGVLRDSWMASLLADDPRGPSEPWPAEAPVPGAGR